MTNTDEPGGVPGQGRRMTLLIDSAACSGAGTCEAMHPELFRVGAEGIAVVSRSELTDQADIEAASGVLDVCPTEAVRLVPAGEGAAEAP